MAYHQADQVIELLGTIDVGVMHIRALKQFQCSRCAQNASRVAKCGDFKLKTNGYNAHSSMPKVEEFATFSTL